MHREDLRCIRQHANQCGYRAPARMSPQRAAIKRSLDPCSIHVAQAVQLRRYADPILEDEFRSTRRSLNTSGALRLWTIAMPPDMGTRGDCRCDPQTAAE